MKPVGTHAEKSAQIFGRLMYLYWIMIFDQEYRAVHKTLLSKERFGPKRSRSSGPFGRGHVLNVCLYQGAQETRRTLDQEPGSSRDLAIGFLMLIFDCASNPQREHWLHQVSRDEYAATLKRWHAFAGPSGLDPLLKHAERLIEHITRPDRLTGQP